jgi:hypothetical protein
MFMKSEIVLFLGAALVGAAIAYPVSSDAATWRQYSPAGCSVDGQARPAVEGTPGRPRTAIQSAKLVNNIVAPPGGSNYWPDEDSATFVCPIVEDESVHVKGGAKVSVTFAQYDTNWRSHFLVCASFENAVGYTCQSPVYTSGASAVKAYTSTPAASVWSTGLYYGFVWVVLGSRKEQFTSTMAYTPSNEVLGYWLSTP